MAEKISEQTNTALTEEQIAALESEEEIFASILLAEHELNVAEAQKAALIEDGMEFKRPSYLKYGALGMFAVVVDIVDLLDLTGIGAIVGRIVSAAAMFLMLLIYWLTNTKQKKADEYVEQLETNLAEIEANVARAGKQLLAVTRMSRRIPGVRQVYRRAYMRTIRPARLVLRNATRTVKSPLTRSALAGVINLIPFLAVVPWMTVGVYLSYRAEKHSYKMARESAEDAASADGQEQYA